MSDGEHDQVRVVIGALDDLSLADVTRWMRGYVFAPRLPLEVDLAEVNHRHAVALLTLLIETDARARPDGTRVVVLNAPRSMAADLATASVHIRRRSAVVAVAPPRKVTFPALTHRTWPAGHRSERAQLRLADTDGHRTDIRPTSADLGPGLADS